MTSSDHRVWKPDRTASGRAGSKSAVPRGPDPGLPVEAGGTVGADGTLGAAETLGADGTLGAGGQARWTTAVWRGVSGRCPVCGGSPIFAGYLAVRPHCGVCGTPLGEVPADDAPPWVTMFIALHVLIGTVVALGEFTALGTGATIAIMLPAALLLCLALLRPVKGGMIAVLLKLGVRREDQG